MAKQTEIQVLISVKDKASAALKSVGDSVSQMGSRFDRVKGVAGAAIRKIGQGLKEIGFVAVGVAAGFVAFATKAAFAGAKFGMLEKTLEVVAKNTGISTKEIERMKDQLAEINTRGSAATETILAFARSGLSAQTDFTKFIGTVKDFAASVGVSSDKAIKDFTTSLVRLQPELLSNYGIELNLNQLYADTAKKLGKNTQELTATEKRQALLNEVFRQGKDVLGVYAKTYDTAGKNVLSIQDRFRELVEFIGIALEPAFAKITNIIQKTLAGIVKWFRVNQDQVKEFGAMIEQVTVKLIGGLEKVFTFLINNKEIVLGIFVALGAGLATLAVGFLIAHAAAILVFAGITTLVTVFAKIWNSNWGGIQGKTRLVLDFLLNKLVPGVRNTVQFVIGSIRWLKDNWIFSLGFIIGFMATLPLKIANALWTNRGKIIDIIKRIGKAMLDTFINGVKALVEEAKKLPGKLFEAVKSAPGKAGEFFKGVFKGAGVPGFQAGTDFSPSGPAIVGERGPELVDLPSGSKVTPMAGAGSVFNVTINVGTLIDSDNTRRNFAEKLMGDIENIAP